MLSSSLRGKFVFTAFRNRTPTLACPERSR
jgi:hypothetical protein